MYCSYQLLKANQRYKLKPRCRPIWASTDMSPSSARPVSSGYVNFSDLGVQLTQNLRPHSYIRLSRRALTTATQSWRARRKRRPTNCNECWTPQIVWSAVPTSLTQACHDSSIPSYIGWMFLGVMVLNCLHCQAPPYLVELCHPVAGVASRQHLQSATRQLLVVPRHQLSSYGRRAFCVAGPSVWNSLADSLRNPIISGNSFRQSLKTFLFATYWCIQRIRGFTTMIYINRLFTYLLTYLRTRTHSFTLTRKSSFYDNCNY